MKLNKKMSAQFFSVTGFNVKEVKINYLLNT